MIPKPITETYSYNIRSPKIYAQMIEYCADKTQSGLDQLAMVNAPPKESEHFMWDKMLFGTNPCRFIQEDKVCAVVSVVVVAAVGTIIGVACVGRTCFEICDCQLTW